MYKLFFFGNEFESSKACGRPARLCLSSFQPSRCLLDSDSSWAAIIRVTVPHVTLTGIAWPLAVDRTGALVSAANSLTPIKRDLVCILTHLQGAKVQLLFGHCVLLLFSLSCLDMWSFQRMWLFVDACHMSIHFHVFLFFVFCLNSRLNWLNTHWKIWK